MRTPLALALVIDRRRGPPGSGSSVRMVLMLNR